MSGLCSRIPVLKTKEEGILDYQSWKDEVEDSCKYAQSIIVSTEESRASMFCFLTIPLNVAVHLCMLFIWVVSNKTIISN